MSGPVQAVVDFVNTGDTFAFARQHFDNQGWKEGRDPGAAFDNEFYLARNADVKAAGVNPLAHYLEFGQAEGRTTFAAVGRPTDIKGGFDAEYYLLANGDVATAASAAGGKSRAGRSDAGGGASARSTAEARARCSCRS